MTGTDVVVVGAGPAGLAVAACLGRSGVPHLVLERETEIASVWRRHYDRLHLHTSRRFSSLPHRPMPRTYPRYPSRDQVVSYLEAYARAEGIAPRLGVEVETMARAPGGWVLETGEGPLPCRIVVLATGVNGRPRRPDWPGLESFPGPTLHSADYRNGAELTGRDVLVVGFGNSGGEIALDLVEHGARPTVSVRSRVNVVPRDILGIPILAIAIPLAKLPARLADFMVWPVLKARYPSYRRLGLSKARAGPFRQIADRGRIPLLDIGTVREIRGGRIRVRGDVVGVSGETVRFEDDESVRFDAIVFATGYEPALPPGASNPPAGADVGGGSGLYFCGFFVAPTGMLREIGLEAQRIVDHIVESRGRLTEASAGSDQFIDGS